MVRSNRIRSPAAPDAAVWSAVPGVNCPGKPAWSTVDMSRPVSVQVRLSAACFSPTPPKVEGANREDTAGIGFS
jgi:hypothetical protein